MGCATVTTPSQERSVGFLHALLAYGIWGLFPLYWKLYHSISPIETVSHRLLWSLVVLAILVVALKQTAELRSIFRSPKRLALLATTALLLSTNWGLFIYGVVTDRVVEGSLGYFLNPLVNILLAMVFLRERLTSGADRGSRAGDLRSRALRLASRAPAVDRAWYRRDLRALWLA